ncbi:MAG: DUF896 domain-containing protein [Clostridiales bacterium]|nr:MAG: DUF896 domain-containing protein [Clostridiales bacterium]
MIDIERLNYLAKKSKNRRAYRRRKKAEQAAIRREYIDSVKASLKAQLDNTYIVDENGEKHKVQPKKKQ